jgi:hypothetical protein
MIVSFRTSSGFETCLLLKVAVVASLGEAKKLSTFACISGVISACLQRSLSKTAPNLERRSSWNF